MSDDKKPPLSPQERQQNEDAAKIETQFGATDAMERFATTMDRIGFGSPGGIFSRTSFEERGLNDMLDLLDGANPSDLVRAGENLEKARTSLNKAAQALSDFVKATDWQGAAATEFQRYGSELARYAFDLGSFANVIGTQMTVAGGGLASVRSAEPPRDNRADPRHPRDFPVSEQREDNAEYKQAVQVEEHRQEAINQMNRLASFYAVSEQSLAGAKEPELPRMPATTVPRPEHGWWVSEPGSGHSGSTGAPGSSPQQPSAVRSDAAGTDGGPHTRTDGLIAETPTPGTSMEIDSVTTLPPTPPSPGQAQPSPVNGGPSAGDGYVPPPRQSLAAMPRGGGFGSGTNARTGTGGGGRPGPAGRPPVMGGVGNSSRAGAGAGATRSPMVGRPNSGVPTVGRAGSGRSGGPRAGRGNGIVGGTPQQRTSGARIPRGNVVGGQDGVPGRSSSAPWSAGRGIPPSAGVVGLPRSGGTPPRPGTGGFTTGGSGLTGERRGRQPTNEEQKRPGQPRPENRTDDEEVRAVRRRGASPPAIG